MTQPQEVLKKYKKLLSDNNTVEQSSFSSMTINGFEIQGATNTTAKETKITSSRNKNITKQSTIPIVFLFQKDVQIEVNSEPKVVTKLFIGGDRSEPEEIYTLEDGYKFWQAPTINKTGTNPDDYIVNFVLQVDLFFEPPLTTNPDLFKFCAISAGNLTQVEFEVPNGFNGYDNYIVHQHGYFNILQVEKRLPVRLSNIFSFIYSGNGLSGNPFSDYTYSANGTNITYYLGGASGLYQAKNTEQIPNLVGNTVQNPQNSIDVVNSVLVSDFSLGNNSFGVEVAGSYIEHIGLTPPATAYSFLSFDIEFNSSNFKVFAKEWDTNIGIIENEIDRLNSALEKKIVPLTLEEEIYTGLQRRQIYLTKAIQETNLLNLIDLLEIKIGTASNSWSFRFEAQDLLVVLNKLVENTVDIPLVLPELLPTDEFALLPSNINQLAIKINEMLLLPIGSDSLLDPFNERIRESNILALNSTVFGERATAITALGLEAQDWFVRVRVFNSIINLNYFKIFQTFSAAPIEIEAIIEGVTYTTVFGIQIGRFIDTNQRDFFYVLLDGAETDSLPFENNQYINSVRWRKRGNTEWFSV